MEQGRLPAALALLPIDIERYSDGEARVEIPSALEAFDDVIVLHRFSRDIGSEVVELVFALAAVRLHRPRRLKLVLPYLPYSRSDRPFVAGGPAYCRVFVQMLGPLDAFVTLDLHSPQVASVFDCPVYELSALTLLGRQVASWSLPAGVVVSTDLGGAKRAGQLGAMLGWDMGVCTKARSGSGSLGMDLLGQVRGRTVVMVDDEIDSGATLLATAHLMEARGAAAIYAVATHARFGASFLKELDASPIRRIAVTDSVPAEAAAMSTRVERIEVGPLFSDWLASGGRPVG